MQTRDGQRVVGVDVARAVAVITMIAAHLTYPDGVAAELLYGFPAALFAFIAGVSLGFMAHGRATPAHVAVRGALVAGLGWALSLVPTSIVIVLPTLGVCMILLCRAPWWQSRWLAVAALALTGASGMVAELGRGTTPVLGGPYPLCMWAALMAAGLLAQRHVIGNRRRLAASAAGGGLLLAGDIAARWYVALPAFMAAQGHTGGVVDVVGSVGASISICSLCCLAAHPRQRVLPRVGAMPLTLYCLHVLTSTVLDVWSSVLGACALATVWLAHFPRGPVEDALRRATDAVVNLRTTKEKNDETYTLRPRRGGNSEPGAAGARHGKRHVRG